MKLKPALGVVLVFLVGVAGGVGWDRCHRHHEDASVEELRNARAAAINELRLLESELGYQKIRAANAIAAGERLQVELRAKGATLQKAEVYERMDVAKRAFASLSEEGATGKVSGLEASEGYRVLDRVLRVGNP